MSEDTSVNFSKCKLDTHQDWLKKMPSFLTKFIANQCLANGSPTDISGAKPSFHTSKARENQRAVPKYAHGSA